MPSQLTKLKLTVLMLLLAVCGSVNAQDVNSKAWDAFFNNKRTDARALFNQTLAQNPSNTDALLGLSLLAQMDKPSTEAFDHFKKFYDQSKKPQPYIAALWTTASINESYDRKPAEQIAWLRDLTKHKDYDGMIAAMAYSVLGKGFENVKKIELADKEYANIGSIDKWAISGEFENISTSGFDKAYETLNRPADTAAFLNKKGVKVAWHEVPFIRHDKWIDFTYYANAYSSIIFAQSFVKSDAETEAQLRIGVSGSVKVWFNDQLLISEAEERNNDLDTYIQSIKLHKGYNRILVQIGESYADRSNFLVRITDQQGNAIAGLSATAKAQPYEVEKTYVSHKTEPFAIAYFEQKIKEHPEDYLSRLMLAHAFLRQDNAFEARKTIEFMRKKYPKSTFLNSLLMDVFNKEGNRTGAETLKETIKMADPESSYALILKYQELIGQKEYDKAADVIKRIEALYPHMEEFIYSGKMNIAGFNNNQDEIVKVTEDAYKKFPTNKDFMQVKYAIEANLHKNTPQAISVLKQYVDNNDNYTVSKQLATAYFNLGKAADGLQVYQDEIKNDPIGVGIYSDLGDQYYKQQMYDKAAESYLNCIKISPTTSSYYTSLGKIYEMTNQKDKSIQYYQKGLEMNPNDYASIKSLRKLQDKKEVFSYFTEPDVNAIIKAAPKAADFPDDNSAILNDEVQKIVYENGGSEDRRFLMVKILTQKGIEDWKEYSIDSDNWQDYLIETAEVIKANGSKIPAEKNDANLVFTNLEVGDVINIRYKLENYYQGRLASHFWDSFYFTRGYPTINSKYSLLISKNKKFTYKFSQKDIAPEKSSSGEFDLYVWKGNNQKALTWEDKMPPIADVANILYITSIPDWKFISDWYNDMASAKARTNYEVKEAIKDLFAGKTNLTEMQKVEMIYNYITTNISYSSVSFRQSGLIPQNPSTVLNTRIGDCKDVSTLFVAMCKEAGIKAQLVLVKTRDNGLMSMPVPNIDFNHCIAKVTLNGQENYIELTSQFLPFRSAYNSSLNSLTLDIGGDNAGAAIKYLNPSTRKKNVIKRMMNVTFRDKDFIVKEENYKTAALAGNLREVYRELSQKDQFKKMKERLSDGYPDNEVISLSFKNLDAAQGRDTAYTITQYELKNATKLIAGMSVFSLPWADKFAASDLQVVMPRYSGIDLSSLFYMDSGSETITLTIPTGKKLLEQVAPVTLTNEMADYSLSTKLVGNKLTVTRTFKLKKDFVPVEKVANFNAFYKKVVEADNKELAMK